MLKISFKRGKWVVDEEYCREGICVPEGFKTDLASIPRLFWSIYPPFGKYIEASVIHDYLYRIKFPRRVADGIFRRIMREDGVSWFTRNMFYFAVRLFGWIKYA